MGNDEVLPDAEVVALGLALKAPFVLKLLLIIILRGYFVFEVLECCFHSLAELLFVNPFFNFYFHLEVNINSVIDAAVIGLGVTPHIEC